MAKVAVTAAAPALAEGEFTSRQLEQLESMIEALSPAKRDEAVDLYIIRYRHGQAMIQTGFIRATSLAGAEKVGHTYCDSLPGCRYINVAKAVIADESILNRDAQDRKEFRSPASPAA